MLAFAEESQAVQVVRNVERIEVDENRPPVPRRFYARWNQEIDEVTGAAEDNVLAKMTMPPYSFKDPSDSIFASRWKNYFTAMRDHENVAGKNLADSGSFC